MKKSLLAVIILPILTLSSCSLFSNDSETSKKYTPYQLLTKNRETGIFIYKGDEVRDMEDIFRNEIMKITNYKNVKELKTTSNDYFIYSIKTSGVGLTTNMGADFTFYSDGYVDVDIPDSYSSLKDHYYYTFNQDECDNLFSFVNDFHKEGRQIENEINVLLDSFTIDHVFTCLDKKEYKTFTYYIDRDYRKDINNNDELYSLIKNATYTYMQNDEHLDFNEVYRSNAIEILDNDEEFLFGICKPNLAYINISRTDKYSRTFKRVYTYSVNLEDINSIYAKIDDILNNN